MRSSNTIRICVYVNWNWCWFLSSYICHISWYMVDRRIIYKWRWYGNKHKYIILVKSYDRILRFISINISISTHNIILHHSDEIFCWKIWDSWHMCRHVFQITVTLKFLWDVIFGFKHVAHWNERLWCVSGMTNFLLHEKWQNSAKYIIVISVLVEFTLWGKYI